MGFTFQLDWLAIIVATFSAFLFSMIWYIGLFRGLWMRAMGQSAKKIQQGITKGGFIIPLVAFFLVSFVLEVLVKTIPLTTKTEGIVLGVLAWVGFYLSQTNVLMVMGTADRKRLFWVDNLHYLIVLPLISLILVMMG
jgi:glucan phosphoethanolaminetransferase (alkaline phosphatase superfamily)